MQHAPAFALAGEALGGEMGALIRAHDWAATALGPIESWPVALRTLVAMILESSLPAIIGWGPELLCLHNDAYRPLLGNKQAVLGAPFREVWADARDAIEPIIDRALAGEPSFFEDASFALSRSEAPEQAYFDCSFGPVRDDQGRIAGFINQAIETTGRVLAGRLQAFRILLDDALRDLTDPRELMFAAAKLLGRQLRASRAGYAEIDAAVGRVTIEHDWTDAFVPSLAGQHALDDFGAPLAAALESGCVVQLDDVTSEPLTADFAEAFAQIELRAAVAVPLIKNGKLVALLYVHQARPRAWTDEEVAIVREVAERTWEVVERARAEAELRATTRRLQLILESTVDYAILTTDRGGRITLWNPGAEHILGWSQAEMLGQHAGIFFTPEDLAKGMPEREMERAALEGRAADERQHLRKDGSRFFASGMMMPLRDDAGELIGFLKILRDRTREHEAGKALERGVAERTAELAAANRELVGQIQERERIETTLRQMQRLEAVGQLTSGVAHDFNNLLTVIVGNIGFLQRALDNPQTHPKLLQRLGYMQGAAERGAKLTAQLLAFSRRQRLEAKPVDLNETVASMRELLQSSMGGSVQLETVQAPELWPALVDRTQIELVILNLAINARDAMQVGGSLSIETANVTLHEPQAAEEPGPGDYVMISVTDTGTGMPPEVLAKAFEPFFTTKEVGKGSGLGLAQVYGFAKQSGGGVRIRTRLGEGTTIEVFLPRAVGVRSGVAEPMPAAHGAPICKDRHCRILLVDDDASVREVTAAILVERGYELVEAGSGGAALDVLSREGEDIDLLLIDFAMPGMNGLEVAREARVRRPGLPVLFVTGYADSAAMDEMSRERIISKPFREDDLVSRIDDALGANASTRRPA